MITGFLLDSDLGTDPVTIGAAAAGQGNLVSGNNATGIDLGTSGSTVVGNRIGANAAGTAAVANAEGIYVNSGATGASIDQNQISGNTVMGVVVNGPHRDCFHRQPDRHGRRCQRRNPERDGSHALGQSNLL